MGFQYWLNIIGMIIFLSPLSISLGLLLGFGLDYLAGGER
jgi:hypothetical protein